jgi:hypothetical protein
MIQPPPDKPRWVLLGLHSANPQKLHRSPTPDVLAYGLMTFLPHDPVYGMIDAVRIDLEAMAEVMSTLGSENTRKFLQQCARRLDVAMVLLMRCDGWDDKPPPEDDAAAEGPVSEARAS